MASLPFLLWRFFGVSALPDTDVQFTTVYTTTSPELRYTIDFTTIGVYTVWLRGYPANAAGDSLYISLDDQPATSLTGFAPGKWSCEVDPFVKTHTK